MNQHTRCKTLMVQGCTSDAGKTVLVAALCRILARRGIKVAPFKPQNMALNSAVTADGGEIGRAQALQALAAGIPPQIDFNPILLKPSSDKQAQVIIHGHAAFNLDARSYHEYKPRAMQAVLESWRRLQADFDCIVVEGAGSPAEINLRERDIANMGFAETVDCPVILIGDIDRGGVFAHLTGTLNLLSPSEQARIKGFVINRFRGDIGLLQSGLDWLEAHTQKPVLGVVPYLMGLFLDAEDALAKEHMTKPAAQIQVIAPATPRISNHNDFDPLRLHPQVDFRFIGPGETIPASDLIILPGSKNVRADLAWLKAAGWHEHLQHHLRYGGKVIGICGGLQMLGQAIHDPEGRESTPGSETGFACLDLETTLHAEKKLENVHGFLALPGSPSLSGYEIHQGISQGPALAHPALWLSQGDAGEKQRPDGALSNDGKILATYCHGLFDRPEALSALLQWSGMNTVKTVDFAARREADIERLADAVEGVLDWKILAPYL